MANPGRERGTEGDPADPADASFPLSVRVAILLALIVLVIHTAVVSRALGGGAAAGLGGWLTLVLLSPVVVKVTNDFFASRAVEA